MDSRRLVRCGAYPTSTAALARGTDIPIALDALANRGQARDYIGGGVPRLRRVDCSESGIVRRRRGKGFEYLDETGETIWNQTYTDNVIHFVNGSLQSGVLSTTAAQVRDVVAMREPRRSSAAGGALSVVNLAHAIDSPVSIRARPGARRRTSLVPQ